MPHPLDTTNTDTEAELSKHSLLFAKIRNSPYQYSQQLCIDLCLQHEVIAKCKCSMPNEYPFFAETTTCPLAQNECINNVTGDFLATNMITVACLAKCPLECDRAYFKTTLSSSQLVGSWFVPSIAKRKSLLSDFVTTPLSAQSAKHSVARVNIYYDTLSYTVTSELPKMDMVALMANIGGTLSLFLGISVLSVFEVVDVLIEIYFTLRSEDKVSNANT